MSNNKSLKLDLKSWEVNFTYKEDREKKSALVKLRLCTTCGGLINTLNNYNCPLNIKKIIVDMLNYKKIMRCLQNDNRTVSKSEKEDEGEYIKSRKRRLSDDTPAALDEKIPKDEESSDVKEYSKKLASSVWSSNEKSQQSLIEKSKEEEMDDFFNDLLL